MKLKKIISFVLATSLLSLGACSSDDSSDSSSKQKSETPATLTLIGHASAKIVTSEGKVIYIDPAYEKTEGAYTEPADIILVTHSHDDHNKVSLVTKKDGCQVITNKESHPKSDEYKSFEIDGIKIEAVAASNKNHNIDDSVGYVLTFDGKTVYHAGDTSIEEKTIEQLKGRTIDYAMYPIDGQYNMAASAAAEFANSIGAKNNIPIHIDGVYAAYNAEKAKTFTPNGAMYIEYGKTITL